MEIKNSKPKIAFLISKFPVISETFILNEITGAIGNGFDIKIIAQLGKSKKMHPDVITFHLLDRLYPYKIPTHRIIKIIKAIGILIRLSFTKPVSFFRILKNHRCMNFLIIYLSVHFVKMHDFDIIYCHFGHNGRTAALLKKIGIIKSRIITVFHGFEISQKRYLRKGYYDVLFREGDLFLPVCHTWKQRLISLGCDEKKIIVHRMGINLDKFTLINNRIKNNMVKLLTIARLTEKKGLEYAIKAFHWIISKSKVSASIKYTIIGDGELRDDLYALVIKLGLKEMIHFTGSMDQEEIITCMQNSNIFILHSVTCIDGNMEGIPVVLMEAMASGLPVISTFHSGIPELVKNGEAGFLVPERDVRGLAEKILYVMNNKHLWKKIGERGRKIIEKEFNSKKLNSELKGIFEKI
jgi:colanic acid/amylovoran biosynthesis glycosyltransferase